jgi:hypothetical protein
MGCDIHIFIEKRVKDGWQEVVFPKWLLPRDRNYALFGFLSRVRSLDYQSSFLRNGWPGDSQLKAMDFPDFHSFGYSYLDNIRNLSWPFELEDCYFNMFMQYICMRHPDLEDVEDRDIRILVCYDN